MGSNFLATAIGGALSGVSYTWLYGWLRDAGHLFVKAFGEFREQEA